MIVFSSDSICVLEYMLSIKVVNLIFIFSKILV